MDSYQSNHLSVLQIPLTATILLIWCQMSLKCSYPRKVCFWKNRESNTFKGWRKFSSIYLGQWNIHHTETQTPYRIKDQKSYIGRRSKSQCLWGNQTSNCLNKSPCDFSPKFSLCDQWRGRRGPQNMLAKKMWLKNNFALSLEKESFQSH